jgi:hypothetical protein
LRSQRDGGKDQRSEQAEMTAGQKTVWMVSVLIALGVELFIWRSTVLIWLEHIHGLTDTVNK